jgi:hypothetical protein
MTFQGGSKAPPTSSSWIESGKGQNVDDEIHKYSYGRAVTDPRDAVFSILGFLDGRQISTWDINYSKDTVEVFIDAVENIVTTTESLGIICHSAWSLSQGRQGHIHMHSWLPRISGEFEECKHDICNFGGFLPASLTHTFVTVKNGRKRDWADLDYSAHSAAGDTKPQVIFDRSNRRLLSKGFPIGVVKQVLQASGSGFRNCRIPKHWKHVALSFQPNGGKGSLLSDEERQTANFETFWRTLVANRKQFVFLLNDTDISYESIYDGVLVRNAKEIRDRVKTPAPSRWAEQCWKWMKGDMAAQLSDSGFRFKVAHTAGRLGSSYIITEDNMGLGPTGAQNGDIICVLLGFGPCFTEGEQGT